MFRTYLGVWQLAIWTFLAILVRNRAFSEKILVFLSIDQRNQELFQISVLKSRQFRIDKNRVDIIFLYKHSYLVDLTPRKVVFGIYISDLHETTFCKTWSDELIVPLIKHVSFWFVSAIYINYNASFMIHAFKCWTVDVISVFYSRFFNCFPFIYFILLLRIIYRILFFKCFSPQLLIFFRT